jgi:hypothetical protein
VKSGRERLLEQALRAFMKDAEGMARSSYAAYHRGRRVFNESIWEHADLDGYRLWKRAKVLLAGKQ